MFNFLSHQQNANQNYFELSSYTSNSQDEQNKWQPMLVTMWGKGPLIHCWWDHNLAKPLWKLAWSFLRKLEIDLIQETAIPILDICPKDNPSYPRDICLSTFISILFIKSRNWKKPRCLLAEWMKKIQYNYIMKYYSSTKTKTTNP